MKLPNEADISLAYGEEKRIEDAVAALQKDPHAPRSLTVTINLHVHQEYPKHVGDKIVNSAEEEDAALAAIEAAKPKEPAPVETAKAAEPAATTPVAPVAPIALVPPAPAAPAAEPTSDPNPAGE